MLKKPSTNMNKINQIEKCTWRRPYFALNQGKGKLNGRSNKLILTAGYQVSNELYKI